MGLTQEANFSGGPGRLSTYTQNVATAGTPLTAGATTLFTVRDARMRQRGLTVKWTGDQTLDLLIFLDLGNGGAGLQQVAGISFIAGNVTPQIATFYYSPLTGLPAGTSLVSGTAPTLDASPAVSNTQWLAIPADRIQVQAKAGGTTTVGALAIDLNETD